MTRLERLFYRLRLKEELIQRDGTAFQALFAAIMDIAHPGDFVPVTAWGPAGDLKNDGFLPSESTLFQCYAPRCLGTAAAIRKIEEDSAGALAHWPDRFTRWVFVHNVLDGVPAPILSKLTELEAQHPGVSFAAWGPQDLENRLLLGAPQRLADLLGTPWTASDLVEFGFDEIRVVVDHLQTHGPPADQPIDSVSAEKLSANCLSPETEEFLRMGMRRSRTVGQFFRQYHDVMLGDRIAIAFRREYERLKLEALSPDEIYARLAVYARGHLAQGPRLEAAVITVLAYLFEQCDIFEPAPGVNALDSADETH